MSPDRNVSRGDRRRIDASILVLATAAASLYGWLAWRGELTDGLSFYLPLHGVLVLIMVVAWRIVRRGGRHTVRIAIGAALLFRVVAAVGEPALSDDVYRYLWDGRVQLHGIHPFRHAPDDPALAGLRDADWERINHPDLHTIYPPFPEAIFWVLAAVGAGARGFKLTAGVMDFGVVLAMVYLLRGSRLPRDRVVLYAWNPLAIVETSGSGHAESLGVALIVLCAAWAYARRPALSALGLAGAVHAKLIPLALVPGYLRRWTGAVGLLFAVAVILMAVPYALTGPPLGGGLLDYAGRWERNGLLFPGILGIFRALNLTPWLKDALTALQSWTGEEALPWDWLYRHVWPPYLARATAAALALAWILAVSLRGRLDAARESLMVLGAVLLLSPTLHPWYVLWILPFAAATLSRGWLVLAALVPLAYLGGDGDVPWSIRAVEYLPAVSVMAWDGIRSWKSARASMPG